MTSHRPYRSWCKFCVMGRGGNSPHKRSDARDDLEGVLHVPTDYGFLGGKENEEQVIAPAQMETRDPDSPPLTKGSYSSQNGFSLVSELSAIGPGLPRSMEETVTMTQTRQHQMMKVKKSPLSPFNSPHHCSNLTSSRARSHPWGCKFSDLPGIPGVWRSLRRPWRMLWS